jgi:hypothetical protein
MKSIFPFLKEIILHGMDWIKCVLEKDGISESTVGFIYQLNCYCLKRKVNAIFYNRYNILQFFHNKPGIYNSNNMGSMNIKIPVLDSS